jgi:hypothetical protein
MFERDFVDAKKNPKIGGLQDLRIRTFFPSTWEKKQVKTCGSNENKKQNKTRTPCQTQSEYGYG